MLFLRRIKGRATLPSYLSKELVKNIATESSQGVVWLHQNAEIIPQDSNIFQRSFGVVRKVTTREAASIFKWIEFAGNTMKTKGNLVN